MYKNGTIEGTTSPLLASPRNADRAIQIKQMRDIVVTSSPLLSCNAFVYSSSSSSSACINNKGCASSSLDSSLMLYALAEFRSCDHIVSSPAKRKQKKFGRHKKYSSSSQTSLAPQRTQRFYFHNSTQV